ncbi:MAG TPA: DUF2461 domain-containing protein, partial [Vicinamibacterales bacterium]|nr:DUF2461 domain-containing protein [Vicinamibacterales bacterium]
KPLLPFGARGGDTALHLRAQLGELALVPRGQRRLQRDAFFLGGANELGGRDARPRVEILMEAVGQRTKQVAKPFFEGHRLHTGNVPLWGERHAAAIGCRARRRSATINAVFRPARAVPDVAPGLPRLQPASPRFSEEALRLLRALARHNTREWFRAHRDRYERLVRAPMLALIDRLAIDLPAFLPELVASPRVSLYRIWRDTRFSEDKSPLKTHIAAVFPARGLPRHEAPGLYLEVSGRRVFAGGGLYRPQPTQLRLVREHIAAHPDRFRRIVEAPAFRRAFGRLEGDRLARVPAGVSRDHPAAEYLKFRQFLAGREWPPELAAGPRFYSTLIRTYRRLAPLILCEPLRPAALDPLLGRADLVR